MFQLDRVNYCTGIVVRSTPVFPQEQRDGRRMSHTPLLFNSLLFFFVRGRDLLDARFPDLGVSCVSDGHRAGEPYKCQRGHHLPAHTHTRRRVHSQRKRTARTRRTRSSACSRRWSSTSRSPLWRPGGNSIPTRINVRVCGVCDGGDSSRYVLCRDSPLLSHDSKHVLSTAEPRREHRVNQSPHPSPSSTGRSTNRSWSLSRFSGGRVSPTPVCSARPCTAKQAPLPSTTRLLCLCAHPPPQLRMTSRLKSSSGPSAFP